MSILQIFTTMKNFTAGKRGCFSFFRSINFFKRRRVKKTKKDSFFTEEGERETKVFEDEPFVMAKPGLENVSENDFAFISDIIITKREGKRIDFNVFFIIR